MEHSYLLVKLKIIPNGFDKGESTRDKAIRIKELIESDSSSLSGVLSANGEELGEIQIERASVYPSTFDDQS